YRLKPDLVWHDGADLSAEDFAFAWRVYATPAYGVTSGSAPINLIDDVSAPDPRTLVIRWRRPYAEAAQLEASQLQALPRPLPEEHFRQLSPEAFAALPFWTVEYVGLGPYRLTHWERTSYLEGEAFDRYVLGRPRIGRHRMLVIPDSNTVLANFLAGEAHVVGDDDALAFQQGA